MSISSIRKRLSCRLPRLVSRVIVVAAVGAGLTACVVHEPNYRANRHYGSHVTVIEKQPRSGYRHRHARSRPVATPRPRPRARPAARPTRPHARPAARPTRPHARPAARPTRPHTRPAARPTRPAARPGARPQARPTPVSRRTSDDRRSSREETRRR